MGFTGVYSRANEAEAPRGLYDAERQRRSDLASKLRVNVTSTCNHSRRWNIEDQHKVLAVKVDFEDR
jgi:hypothetical protein